jgi:hypothetical protein
MNENNQDRPQGWGKTGPAPKRLEEKIVLGIPVGRGDNREIVPPEEVYKLASIGCTDREIAAFFGVKEDTLRRNFADNLAKGREYTKTRLRMNMFKAADNLNPAILIFLAKNILGMQNEPTNTEDSAALPWVEGVDDELEKENHDEEIE